MSHSQAKQLYQLMLVSRMNHAVFSIGSHVSLVQAITSMDIGPQTILHRELCRVLLWHRCWSPIGSSIHVLWTIFWKYSL